MINRVLIEVSLNETSLKTPTEKIKRGQAELILGRERGNSNGQREEKIESA